jgi:inhibitor of cysteine peptidase
MRKRVSLIAAAAVLLLAGTAFAARTLTIGPKANGTTVRLKAGDTLRVSLPGNPSTGYTWQVVKVDRKVLKPAGYVFKPHASRPGAGGVETRRFTALKAGTTRLKLGQTQSGSGQIAKTFLVVVAVG